MNLIKQRLDLLATLQMEKHWSVYKPRNVLARAPSAIEESDNYANRENSHLFPRVLARLHGARKQGVEHTNYLRAPMVSS